MTAIYRYLCASFFFCILGMVGVTLVAPYVFSTLLTPPISFGTNCAPAGEWSMSRLAITQGVAGAFGLLFGFTIAVWLRPKKKKIIPVA